MCDVTRWFAFEPLRSPELQLIVGPIFSVWSQDLSDKECRVLPFMLWKHSLLPRSRGTLAYCEQRLLALVPFVSSGCYTIGDIFLEATDDTDCLVVVLKLYTEGSNTGCLLVLKKKA